MGGLNAEVLATVAGAAPLAGADAGAPGAGDAHASSAPSIAGTASRPAARRTKVRRENVEALVGCIGCLLALTDLTAQCSLTAHQCQSVQCHWTKRTRMCCWGAAFGPLA